MWLPRLVLPAPLLLVTPSCKLMEEVGSSEVLHAFVGVAAAAGQEYLRTREGCEGHAAHAGERLLFHDGCGSFSLYSLWRGGPGGLCCHHCGEAFDPGD